jgi:hypothetical protein
MAHMLSGRHSLKCALHAVAQNGAIGEPGQSVKSRQVVDLGLGDLSLGDILHKHDHAAVFHGLYGEFERPSVQHIRCESGIVAARKPGVQALDQALRVEIGNQTRLDNAFDQVARLEPFSSKSGGNPSCA